MYEKELLNNQIKIGEIMKTGFKQPAETLAKQARKNGIIQKCIDNLENFTYNDGTKG